MIDGRHDLSISKQAKALKISRGSVYYQQRKAGLIEQMKMAVSAAKCHVIADAEAEVIGLDGMRRITCSTSVTATRPIFSRP